MVHSGLATSQEGPRVGAGEARDAPAEVEASARRRGRRRVLRVRRLGRTRRAPRARRALPARRRAARQRAARGRLGERARRRPGAEGARLARLTLPIGIEYP